MKITDELRAQILHEDRSARSKKAAATLRKRFGKNYFKKLRAKGNKKLSTVSA